MARVFLERDALGYGESFCGPGFSLRLLQTLANNPKKGQSYFFYRRNSFRFWKEYRIIYFLEKIEDTNSSWTVKLCLKLNLTHLFSLIHSH